MDTTQNTAPAPIDLNDYWKRFWKVFCRAWFLIPLLACLLAGITYLRSNRTFTPIYKSSAVVSVGSAYAGNDIFSPSTFYSNSTATAQMVNSLPHLLGTEFMQDLIKAQLDEPYINGSISSESIADTNLIELSVTSTDPQDAYDILNAVIACYPQAAVYMVDNPAIYVRQEAVVPTEPINSYVPSNAWMDSAKKGAAAGLAIIVILTILNKQIVDAEDLKKITSVPILLTMSRISSRGRRRDEDILLTDGTSPVLTEAMRSLRAKVRRKLDQTGGNVILFTSTVPGEGKTTVSTNLALSLAEEGHRVLLLDADLRKQSIARLFRCKQQGKAMMYCLHNCTEEAIFSVIKEAPQSSLHYISGAPIQKTHYAIDPRSLQQLLDLLSRHYDYVVVDTPPCNVVSDTKILSHYANCVLYVVKADGVSKIMIQEAITGLHQQNVVLSGCVLNGVRSGSTQNRYGYGYGKKYGYGKSASESAAK